MFSSQTDSLLRSFSRGPRKADPHSRVYNPPKDDAIIAQFASTAQGGVKGEFKNFFAARFPPFHHTPPPLRPRNPRKPLILLTIVGSVPKFWGNGERGMGNGEASKKIFRPPQSLAARAFPHPRAAGQPGKRGYISLRLIFLSTFLLKSRGPPKKRISDCVIGIPCARRSSIRRKVQTKSAI